jgi:hypothetical protein
MDEKEKELQENNKLIIQENETKDIINVSEKILASENLLKKEMNEIDELYLEVKSHLDKVKEIRSKSRIDLNAGLQITEKVNTFPFIYQQTTNIIALKNLKLNLIKELNSLIKTDADLALKNFAAMLKNKSNEADVSKILSELLNVVMTEKNTSPKDFFNSELESTDYEEIVELELEKRLSSGKLDENLFTQDEDYYESEEEDYLKEKNIEDKYSFKFLDERRKLRLVYDVTNERLYICNKNQQYHFLEDYGYSEDMFSIIYNEEENSYYEENIVKGYIEALVFEEDSSEE